MPGFTANPFQTLRRADFYVSPSNAEGFPNSLLEAMSVGLPVISTNCPSGPSEVLAGLPREQVQAGVSFAQHGILVQPDDPAAMPKRCARWPIRRPAGITPRKRRSAQRISAWRAPGMPIGRSSEPKPRPPNSMARQNLSNHDL